jgi:hypothetical protein
MIRSASMGFWLLLTSTMMPSLSLSWADGAGEGSIISFFVIGGVDPDTNPLTGYFIEDPAFIYSGQPIPSYLTLEEKRRLDRLYYPRTRQALLEGYDMLIMVDARIGHLPTSRLGDLDYALREAGMPAFTTFGMAWESDWVPTTLYDLVPVSTYEKYQHGPYHVFFRRERDPVFLPFVDLGLERIIGGSYHTMTPKVGALIWADMVPLGLPFLVSWKLGGEDGGLIWTLSGAFDAAWWGSGGSWGTRGSNPYAIDLATNLIFHSLGRGTIKDIKARREARRSLSAFQAQKLLVLSMMEWADRLGADVSEAFEALRDLEAGAGVALGFYLEGDYPATISSMDEVSSGVNGITEDVVALKDRTLFWIYVSEWLTVTSVAMITSYLLWALMIRRRLYRVIESTRLGPA